MKFRNGKRTEFHIVKLVEGQWEPWDHDFKTAAQAEKALRSPDHYMDQDHFAVVEVQMTMVARGTKKCHDPY